ncbi:predicted protein [Plenodomus lingam JN3]|uniref:Predicted protein n=1 Tax=Leptosphaeria maculans (strain JN3 / isolate v23.1.3 / race Av1-4-5-6-7-8) TaxID=985895 RepID=E5R559_LEPMJ|nr:predicted protein [Plenodomus lingam JN3]CBX92029.1 predicted protein [Plenodomus lingam JN3]
MLLVDRILRAPDPSSIYFRGFYFSGQEPERVLIITPTCLLHCWDPEREHISHYTSSSGLRVFVGLAYQIGLHREPL